MNLSEAYFVLFVSAVLFLAVLICFCLVRAIRGPKIPDRIVAVNMIGTMTIIIISVLSVFIGEDYLVDICLIYAMISFLAVVVITKVYMGVHEEAKHLAGEQSEGPPEAQPEIDEIESEKKPEGEGEQPWNG